MPATVKIRKQIIPIDINAMTHPQGYVMEDNDLRAAANAALLLGKPLLLTGEAGVGKSQFASWLAHQLDLGRTYKFVVKSTTEARDLFYQYDALARFHEAQVTSLTPADVENRVTDMAVHRYITYNALGKAILHSMGKKQALANGLVSADMDELRGEMLAEPRRSVVLIDEIDKAPRDVPNDILDEIDSLSFTMRELGNRTASASQRLRPVVIITSNSERDLPKPFLRRCVYYHMRFPSPEALQRIVDARVGQRFKGADALLGDALRLFRYLREDAALHQPPGLAELLDWLYGISTEVPQGLREANQDPQLLATLKATLLKDRNDQLRVDRDWEGWIEQALNRG